MSEYGYIPEAPTQSFSNNTGIFTPKDIYDLDLAGKWTNWTPALEHIQTQSTSTSVSSISFTSIGNYDVYLLTAQNLYNTTGASVDITLSNDGGSSYEGGTKYERSFQGVRSSSGSYEEKNSGDAEWQYAFSTDSNSSVYTQGGIVWLYNLNNSAKGTFCTIQNISYNHHLAEIYSFFGGGGYETTEIINAIRVQMSSSKTFSSTDGRVSLYGLANYG